MLTSSTSVTVNLIFSICQARRHSREQMKRMEAGGVKFITYFIGGAHDFNSVKECYADRAIHLERASEIQKIATTMNKRLLSAA